MLKLLIDGKLVDSDAVSLDIFDPSTEQIIAHTPGCSPSDVDAAVRSARRAFDDGPWGKTTGAQRAAFLRAISAKVLEKKAALAKRETLDSGKPLKESEWDMDDVAGCFDYFAKQAEDLDKRQEEKIDLGNSNPNFRCELHYEAAGVVAAIIPWNYPLLMLAWKVAPALAAGCTAVVKPSELTPLTASDFAEISLEVGLPPGVLNIIFGAGSTGEALVNHPLVDKIAFTGSVPTGSKVAAAAARDIKRVTLELGGKSPIIVFEDVDILKAVEWVMFGCFWTNGQICSATSRLLLHEKIAPKFLEVLAEAVKGIPVVNPNLPHNADKTGVIGPVVSKSQYRKVLSYIDGAIKEGAKVVAGGGRSTNFHQGFYILPTVLLVTPANTIWKEEVFGPVLSVVTFSTEQEAIQLANETDYGLAGAVLSNNKDRCTRIVRSLRCGITWINCSQPCFVQAPWGGVKKSGVGRELGPHGIDNYLEPKQITTYIGTEPWGWYKHLPSSL